MNGRIYLFLKKELIRAGYKKEIRWQRDIQPVTDPGEFKGEAIWVILNSGMREQIARVINTRIKIAILNGKDISTAFGHKGKVSAIKYILENYIRLFNEYQVSEDKIEYLQTIPFIGSITKYHLAKNLGHDCIKPDRHLVRIAREKGFSDCQYMCEKIKEETGDKVSLIDIVLWRSANLGWI